MKSLSKLLIAGVAMLAIAPLAHADGLNQISYNGFDAYCTNPSGCTVQATDGSTFTQKYGDVTFVDATNKKKTNVNSGAGYGVFAPFSNTGATFSDYNYLTTGTPFNLISSTKANGDSLTFTVQTLNPGPTSGTDFKISGTGFYTLVENGVTTTIYNGTFDMTSQGGSGAVVSFSDTNAITPEPSSLLLLGTGLMGAAALLFQRRRMGNASAIGNVA